MSGYPLNIFWSLPGWVPLSPTEITALQIQRVHGASTTRIDELTDEALLRLIRSGEEDPLKEIIRRHSPRLLKLIRALADFRILTESPEDLLQETWVLMMHKLSLYNPERPFGPWITRVAINCCRSRLRRERMRRFFFPARNADDREPGDTQASGEVADEGIEIRSALDSLTPKLREVVVLKFYSGLTIDEIGGILRIPSGTVKSRLNAAFEKLRVHLSGQEEKSND